MHDFLSCSPCLNAFFGTCFFSFFQGMYNQYIFENVGGFKTLCCFHFKNHTIVIIRTSIISCIQIQYYYNNEMVYEIWHFESIIFHYGLGNEPLTVRRVITRLYDYHDYDLSTSIIQDAQA